MVEWCACGQLSNQRRTGVTMLNRVFSTTMVLSRVTSISGTVCFSAFGYCSVTMTGMDNISHVSCSCAAEKITCSILWMTSRNLRATEIVECMVHRADSALCARAQVRQRTPRSHRAPRCTHRSWISQTKRIALSGVTRATPPAGACASISLRLRFDGAVAAGAPACYNAHCCGTPAAPTRRYVSRRDDPRAPRRRRQAGRLPSTVH